MEQASKSLFTSNSNMKAFILKILLFSFILATPFCIFYFNNSEFIAAYKVTNSYSFNEKVKWLPSPQQIDVLTIGSSMSLNNVSSQEVVSGFETDQYLNLSSWGLKIKDIAELMPLFIKLYRPKIVLCASNIMDFMQPNVQYNVKEIEEEILNRKSVYTYLFKKYYVSHTRKNKKNYISDDVYTSLKFDNFGGVGFANENFNVADSRWRLRHSSNKIKPENYYALETLSKFLSNHKVQLIFVQSPIRQALQDSKYSRETGNHLQKVKGILKKYDGIAIDLSNSKYSDNFFVDSTHLNRNGANNFTNQFIQKYKTLNTN